MQHRVYAHIAVVVNTTIIDVTVIVMNSILGIRVVTQAVTVISLGTTIDITAIIAITLVVCCRPSCTSVDQHSRDIIIITIPYAHYRRIAVIHPISFDFIDLPNRQPS